MIVKNHTLTARLVYNEIGFSDLQNIVDSCISSTMAKTVENNSMVTNLIDEIDKLPITKREKEVFRYVLDGFSNAEISNRLSISAHTVKNHLTNIFKKLNVTDRVQAMAMFYKR